ncbi:hypothetical protein EON64_14740 [archaeon]|nr:MAG: hypothetical protein EON64_14740 [archaeon]
MMSRPPQNSLKLPTALDIAHIRHGCRVLYDEGLEAMHTIRKPLLTRTHKRKRLDFAMAHRNMEVGHFL